MTPGMTKLIEGGRELAAKAGLLWDMPVDERGRVPRERSWDLVQLCRGTPPPHYRFNALGSDQRCLDALNRERALDSQPAAMPVALSGSWQDLLKAWVLEHALIFLNTPRYIYDGPIRACRFLATVSSNIASHEPWQLDGDDVRHALRLAQAVQPSGKLVHHISIIIRDLFDVRFISANGPLGTGCPEPPQWRGNFKMLLDVDDRPGADRLAPPERVDELGRISFESHPATFRDAILLLTIRINYLTALRIGEFTRLPLDAIRERTHRGVGSLAPELDEIATVWLKHFREKRGGKNDETVPLQERFQLALPMFAEPLQASLDEARRLTGPLRDRLKAQAASGRILPEYETDALVPLTELYPRLCGNPVFRRPFPDELVVRYRETFDPRLLHLIAEQQKKVAGPFITSFYTYWHRFEEQSGAPAFRLADGSRRPPTRREFDALFMRVGELEEFLRRSVPTKLSDTAPFLLANGSSLRADEMLFLVPKRGLIEGRNGGVCDVTRYHAVGRVIPFDVLSALNNPNWGLFSRYGSTPEAKAYKMSSYPIRHLHHTELSRGGVTDAMLGARFNRDVRYNHHYNHRSLGERLAAMKIPGGTTPDAVNRVAQRLRSEHGRKDGDA